MILTFLYLKNGTIKTSSQQFQITTQANNTNNIQTIVIILLLHFQQIQQI